MNRTIYAFDRFQIDARKRLLLCDGQPVQLTPKAFDLLLALIESGGREITKDELMEKVWRDQIVEDANLTVTMSHLRKALGERTNDHRFILTIPGIGYRFIGELRTDNDFIIEQHAVSTITIEQEFNNYDDSVPANQTGALNLSSESGFSDDKNLNAIAAASSIKNLKSASKSKSSGSNYITFLITVLTIVIAFGLATVIYFWVIKSDNPSLSNSSAKPIKSIAVLPFKPLINNNRDESLEMGMADTLITKLSNIKEIHVRPISAVRKYAGLEQDAVAAGREQKVDAVIDGQIQRSGDKIRVTIRLVRVEDGKSLWTNQFDETLTHIFAVQDSISEKVVGALALKLSTVESGQIAKSYTNNSEAYQLYILGRFHLNKLNDEGFLKGRDYFQKAIEKDPNYALAYVALADAYNRLSGWHALSPKEGFPKAREAALKALEIDDRLPEAYTALGAVKLFYDWDWAGAERDLKRAIEINPNSPDAHFIYSLFLSRMERHDEAIAEMNRSLELDPLSLEKIAGIGEIFYLQRQFDKAEEQYRKTLDIEPNSGFIHWTLGNVYVQKGMYKEAIAFYQKAILLSGDSPDEPMSLGYVYALSGRKEESLKIINDLKNRSMRSYIPPTLIALIYAGLGDLDQAFEWLDKGFNERDGLLVLLKTEPIFDKIRSDARYKELVKRVGLPQ